MPPEAAEAAVEPVEEGTPPEQPVSPTPVDQAPAKPKDPDAELRLKGQDYTRKMQKLAAARKELGLDADASEDDFLNAVRTLRQKAERPDPVQDESGITDPRYLEMERRSTERLWQAEETVHGQVAQAGRELQTFMRRTNDPEAITEKMYEVLNRFAAGEPIVDGGGAGEAVAEELGTPPETPQSFGLNEGGPRTGGTVVASPEVTDEFRNSGNVEGFLAKLLAGRK